MKERKAFSEDTPRRRQMRPMVVRRRNIGDTQNEHKTARAHACCRNTACARAHTKKMTHRGVSRRSEGTRACTHMRYPQTRRLIEGKAAKYQATAWRHHQIKLKKKICARVEIRRRKERAHVYRVRSTSPPALHLLPGPPPITRTTTPLVFKKKKKA